MKNIFSKFSLKLKHDDFYKATGEELYKHCQIVANITTVFFMACLMLGIFLALYCLTDYVPNYFYYLSVLVVVISSYIDVKPHYLELFEFRKMLDEREKRF